MSLIASKDKLIFNQPPYTITINRADIKKIALFYQDGLDSHITFPDPINTGFVEVDNALLAQNPTINNEYEVILKIISDKKQIQGKNLFFAKIIYWFINNFSTNNPLIATSDNYQDALSIMGRENIFKALNDLKNNGYPVDHLFNFAHALLDKTTTAEKLDNSFKKHYKKFIALFWIILGILALLLITLIIIK